LLNTLSFYFISLYNIDGRKIFLQQCLSCKKSKRVFSRDREKKNYSDLIGIKVRRWHIWQRRKK